MKQRMEPPLRSGFVGRARDDGKANSYQSANEAWFSQRVWALSGNNVVTTSGGTPATTTRASRIYRPRSAQEIAEVVKSLPATTPIAFDNCHCQAEICVKTMIRARELRATLRGAPVDAVEVRR